MLNKLAFRNVRRSARDYLIYFMTMAVVTALMVSFNTLLFSEEVQNLFQVAGIMAAMIGLATFFIVWIIAWLIHYMIRFILEKRSREFGIYLLVGMKKREIARLYIRENMLLGAGAFAAGLGLGVLLQQVLLSVFYSMVQMDYHLRLEFNADCILVTAACYGGCYLLALLRCRRRFKKMNIHHLLASEKQNEEIRQSHERRRRLLLPLSLLFLTLFGIFLFHWKNWDTGTLLFFLTGLILSIYLFYVGISAWIFCYVKDKKGGVYRGDMLFLLRQFSSKVKTMSFTMGTLTALFTLALLGSSVAFMFNHFQTQLLDSKFPFDVQLYSEQAGDDFQREIQLLKQETEVMDLYRYSIYENGTKQVNTWLYGHLKALGGDYKKADGTPDWEAIDKNADGGYCYCEYDTYMKLSDYNYLRQMLGLAQIRLRENEYAIHLKERVLKETGDFSGSLKIEAKGRELSFAGYHTESFSQDGHNGGDYVIVVPDSAAEAMRPYYAELAADIKGTAPADLQDQLDELDSEETEDADEEEELGNFCCGSDTILVFSVENIVRDNLIPESKYMLCSIIFPLFYVGLVFLCVALTVLSVQQLSDSAKYGFRYKALSRMGCSNKRISRMILKQLLGYYMCPALMALAISGLISVYTGGRFNFYTGTPAPGAAYFLLSAALFFGIYAAYFILTYIGFKRNVLSALQ